MTNHFDEKKLQQAKALAKSPAGQELLETIRKADPSIFEKASAGDFSQLTESLAPILASEEVKKLLKQMGG